METPILEESEVQPVQFEVAELREALRTVPEMWFHFLLASSLTLPVPAFHIDIFRLLITFTVERFALAVPRGHAKTTIVKLAVVWYFIFSPIRFIVYCSNTTAVALDEVRDIINFLECDNFRAVFGDVEWEKKDGTTGLYIFKIMGKRCIIRALGAGQQVRGLNIDNQRPELLICDDAEDDENSSTEGQRNKFRRWVYGPLFKACARHSKKIWIGNLVSANCLIHSFCESPYWTSVKYGCILENGQPLWPEMFSLEFLHADFLEYQQAGMMAKWFAEMMNMPVPEGMGLIRADEIGYKEVRTPGDIDHGFITIDPAISKKVTADKTAIVVHGLCEGKWQIVDYFTGKVGPIELIRHAIALANYWRVRVIGVESVAYQAALQDFFTYYLAQHQQFGMEVVPLYASGVRKAERITAWAGWIKNGDYFLSAAENQATTQLLCYDPSKDENDDDLIDACAYGPQMISTHLNLIMYNPVVPITAKPELAAEICRL